MGILLLALLVRSLAYFSAGGDDTRFVTNDARDYVTLAFNFRAAYLDPESPFFVMGLFRTPVYPAFLGALLVPFRWPIEIAVMAQIILSLLTVWLTVVLGTRLGGPRAALIAAIALAIDPVSALYPCLLQPETLFATLLLGGVLLWTRAIETSAWSTALLSGSLLGLAALTRPIGLFLPLFVAPTILLGPRRPLRGLVALSFLVGSAIPIGGWVVKNQILVGEPVFTILADSSLLHYRAAAALSEDEGISIDEARDRLWKRFWATAHPGLSAAELSQRQRALAIDVLSEHKWAALRTTIQGALRVFSGTGLAAFESLRGEREANAPGEPWRVAGQGLQLIVLIVAYLAVLRAVVMMLRGRQYLELAMSLGVIAYLVGLSAGPEAYTRFRFPAMPFLAALAGRGLSERRTP